MDTHPLPSGGRKDNAETRTTSGAERQPAIKKIIDDFFASEVWVTENGVRRRCSTLEAIVSQLGIKAEAGNRRAARALFRYVEFAKEQGESQEIIFAMQNEDGSYTPVDPVAKRAQL